MFVADKNYYPKTFTGHSLVATTDADVDGNYIETHEFYHFEKVVFYWKVKKNSSDEVIDFRLSIPSDPAVPSVTYVDYDNLT
jgi:hypothetical protein